MNDIPTTGSPTSLLYSIRLAFVYGWIPKFDRTMKTLIEPTATSMSRMYRTAYSRIERITDCCSLIGLTFRHEWHTQSTVNESTEKSWDWVCDSEHSEWIHEF